MDTVYFGFDHFELDSISKDKLNIVAAMMKKNKFYSFEVVGHTDIVGGDEYNYKLSRKRANTVLKYLADQGVDPSKLKIGYYGSSQPKESNENELGRARNRRVEFVILEQ